MDPEMSSVISYDSAKESNNKYIKHILDYVEKHRYLNYWVMYGYMWLPPYFMWDFPVVNGKRFHTDEAQLRCEIHDALQEFNGEYKFYVLYNSLTIIVLHKDDRRSKVYIKQLNKDGTSVSATSWGLDLSPSSISEQQNRAYGF